MRPYVRRQFAVVRYTNYCKLWGVRTGRRCHVESNENKPYKFVGEDIILPQKKNEIPSALNVTLWLEMFAKANLKCYPTSDNIINNPPVKLRLTPSFTQGGLNAVDEVYKRLL